MGKNFVFGCVLVLLCFSLSFSFFVPTIENEEELGIQVCFSFFVFHAKSGTTNNDRTGWSDISY